MEIANYKKLVFNDISDDVWNKLINKIKSDFGIQAKGPSGVASKYGYSIEWNLERPAKQLTIEYIIPPSIDSNIINQNIANFVSANS